MNIGDLIRDKRLKYNLSQLELSKELDIHVQQVSNIERGDAPIPLKRLKDFCLVLKISKKEMHRLLLEDYSSKIKAALK